MTHKDIYIKFVIEYDKANVTSSYPSLTEYEIATFLDKAYQSIITQKLTGNVPRRAGLEMDLKAMEDLEPLIQLHQINSSEVFDTSITNVKKVLMPSQCLYFIDCYLKSGTGYSQTVSPNVTTISDIDRSPMTNNMKSLIGLPQNDIGKQYNIGNISSLDNIKNYANLCFLYLASPYNTVYFVYAMTDEEYNWYSTNSTGTAPLTTPIVYRYSQQDLLMLNLIDICNQHYDKKIIVVPGYDGEDGSGTNTDKSDQPYMPSMPISFKLAGNLITTSSSLRTPMDQQQQRMVPVKLVSHITAQRFFSSAYNLPWIKVPVAYMENNSLFIVRDPIYTQDPVDGQIVFIKKPNPFNKGENLTQNTSYFDWGSGDVPETYKFELSDAVAEEVISLAISYALENVESPRLNTHVGMRGLES